MAATLTVTRRTVITMAVAAALGLRQSGQVQEPPLWPDWTCAPIGWADNVPGVGFRIGHGFACENTWFAAGWWHTGEDWYALDRDTAGASVYAVAGGEVVYADFSYPGRVVIVQHAEDLFTMYGHLDPASVPVVGSVVAAGDQIGTVLQQAEMKAPGEAPSHLHFEVRTFFIRDEINGNTPQHGVNCGFQCPPGPGYWPQLASTHPVDHGWLNPTEATLGRIDPLALDTLDVVSNLGGNAASLTLWSAPDGMSEVVTDRFGIDDIVAVPELSMGEPNAPETSAEAYHAWAKVILADGTEGLLHLAVPSIAETGSDGRPSSVDRIAMFAPGVG